MSRNKRDARRAHLVCGLLICHWSLWAGTSCLSAQDTITLRRKTSQGSTLVGKILDTSRNGIKLSYRGRDQAIPAHEIARLSLAGEPSGLARARAALAAGNDDEALELLEAITLPDSARDIVRQEAGYHRCLAMSNLALKGAGSIGKAGSSMLSFLKQERNTIYFFPAAERLGDLALAAGNFDEAVNYYSQLEKAAATEVQMRGMILQGDVLLAKNDWSRAAKKYEAALARESTNAGVRRQQLLASVGLAVCQGVQGDSGDAIKKLEQIIANQPASDAELFSRVYLALGTIHKQAGHHMDAVLEFLHVDLLFPQQRDAHAQALYHLAELWPQVSQPARGVDARKSLKEQYAGTHWARQLQ